MNSHVIKCVLANSMESCRESCRESNMPVEDSRDIAALGLGLGLGAGFQNDNGSIT